MAMRGFWDDIRVSARRLAQQPAFALVAILALGLGLGANTSIFTLLHGVMFRNLPVARPSELYRLGDDNNCCVNSGLQRNYSLFSYPLYQQLQDSLPEVHDLAAFQANTTITGIRADNASVAQSTPAAFVSGNYFRMLGVAAAAGRLIEPADDRRGAPVVMVMSHRVWRDQFGADPNLIGHAFYINGTPVTLAGITDASFFGETVRANPAGIWLPLGQEPIVRGAGSLIDRPETDWLYTIGRVTPGTSVESVQTKATAALRSWLSAQTFWSDKERERISEASIAVVSASGGVQILKANFGAQLTLLLAMSGLVLVITAANLANLLLARADRATAAIRAALGASSVRLVRQSLAEGLVLALAGCAVAYFIAMVATRAIATIVFPPDTMLPMNLTPSLTVTALSVALALVTGMLFAAAPAWAMAKTDPIQALRGMSREGADLAFMPRRSLVVVQVMLSLVLLAGAGLLSRSLSKLENQPLGFEADQRMVVRIDPPAMAGEPDRLAAVYATMQDRLRRIPGVVNASYALYSPMEGNNWSGTVSISGRPRDSEHRDNSAWNRVGPGYFETMGTRIVRGRGIEESDTPSGRKVAVVNEAFVREFFPSVDPIGQRLGIGGPSHSADYEIVGVAEDVKYSGPTRPVRTMMFVPTMQLAPTTGPDELQTQSRSTLARTIELQLAPGAGNIEAAVRKALAEAHQDLTATRFVPMRDQIAGNFRTNRLLAMLANAYGVLALALAALGLYGVASYGVARRTHEIGVRMALGATRGRIVADVMRGAIIQSAIGLVIGAPLAVYASRALTAQLYQVNVGDPLILGAAAAVLIVTAALAAALPARKAASVDPTKALRSQ
jgi:predicted permease